MTLKEALVEEELYHLIRVVLGKHSSKLNGVEFGKVQPQHSVDGGIADLVLPFADGKHFLVIECKRKIAKPSGTQTIRDFDVFGSNVLNQALNYAMRLGTLAFATTNGSRLALFRTPKAGEPFRIDTHRLLVLDPFKLEEKNVEEILSFLARWQVGVPVKLVEIDWFFISRLRSFVDFLSKSLKPVMKKLTSDKTASKKFAEFSKKVGGVTTEHLARQAAYLLMNKFVFYKILERHYEDLPKLKPISAPDGEYFMKFLKGYFEKAIQVTGDFEPIFITEFYDDIPLPDADYVLDEVNSFIEEMDAYRLEEVGSDVVGYIYEELLPDEERHMLGQFYTPPPIAELIVKWAVRSQKDVILDPAVGSGTFLVKAYKRLMELKAKNHKLLKDADLGNIHKEILSQLYADDINPFPAQLTAMNLAMRNVQYPTSEMNIIVEDFFNLRSRMQVFAPYVIKTPKGDVRRHVTIPPFDAIIANPPYTRGVEITDKTQKSINNGIGDLLNRYKLSGGIGKEIGIYVHFIVHAYNFLKNGGRLGMIISNMWLQTDYGIQFVSFLMDHFKIKAVIDFNQRLFRIPLIATCLVLLEKEKSSQAREDNEIVFLYVDKEAKVEELLDALEDPKGWQDRFLVNVARQGSLPRDEKIVKTMFGTIQAETTIKNTDLMTNLQNLLDARYGNIQGVFARGGTGGNAYFYLNEEDVQKWNLKGYVHPLLSSSRYCRTFTMQKEDWKRLCKKSKSCYVFMAHKPKSKLPESVKAYIRYGETEVKTKADKTCNLSMSSLMRENSRDFFGWYDLGKVYDAPICATRYSQYAHRFFSVDFPLAVDEDFVALVPKVDLDECDVKSILAYLNSDMTRFLIENSGRTTGGGMSVFEPSFALSMPVLNVKKIGRKKLSKLSKHFDRLEEETRRIGGADSEENLKRLQPVIDKIDAEIAEMLGLKKAFLEEVKRITSVLTERRVSRVERATPESISGEEEPKITPPRKMKKRQKATADKQLTRWID